MFYRLLMLLFPPRCILCRAFLSPEETDLCHTCRTTIPLLPPPRSKISYLAGWTAVWYYKDIVRGSLLRYKFSGRRSYAESYGRLLAMKLQKEDHTDFDIITWVPVSYLRRMRRGYDQDELLARVVSKNLGIPAKRVLRKPRSTPSRSNYSGSSLHQVNGVFALRPKQDLSGMRVLLLDDIITTGKTLSECIRLLKVAGAKEVFCAAVASSYNKRN